jgi:hypothetical protein
LEEESPLVSIKAETPAVVNSDSKTDTKSKESKASSAMLNSPLVGGDNVTNSEAAKNNLKALNEDLDN